VAERWFLKIDGIAGESTDANHKDEIDVQSWSWGVSQSGSSGSGGGSGAGKATFDDFHFVSRISRASPALFLACASGSHLKSATLSGVRGAGKAKGGGAEFLKMKMTDVIISSLTLGDAPDAEPAEQISFTYSKVQLTYVPQSSKGSPQPPVTTGWDVKQNKKI
jgi:type VI secretion system secreted protein Hcp